MTIATRAEAVFSEKFLATSLIVSLLLTTSSPVTRADPSTGPDITRVVGQFGPNGNPLYLPVLEQVNMSNPGSVALEIGKVGINTTSEYVNFKEAGKGNADSPQLLAWQASNKPVTVVGDNGTSVISPFADQQAWSAAKQLSPQLENYVAIAVDRITDSDHNIAKAYLQLFVPLDDITIYAHYEKIKNIKGELADLETGPDRKSGILALINRNSEFLNQHTSFTRSRLSVNDEDQYQVLMRELQAENEKLWKKLKSEELYVKKLGAVYDEIIQRLGKVQTAFQMSLDSEIAAITKERDTRLKIADYGLRMDKENMSILWDRTFKLWNHKQVEGAPADLQWNARKRVGAYLVSGNWFGAHQAGPFEALSKSSDLEAEKETQLQNMKNDFQFEKGSPADRADRFTKGLGTTSSDKTRVLYVPLTDISDQKRQEILGRLDSGQLDADRKALQIKADAIILTKQTLLLQPKLMSLKAINDYKQGFNINPKTTVDQIDSILNGPNGLYADIKQLSHDPLVGGYAAYYARTYGDRRSREKEYLAEVQPFEAYPTRAYLAVGSNDKIVRVGTPWASHVRLFSEQFPLMRVFPEDVRH